MIIDTCIMPGEFLRCVASLQERVAGKFDASEPPVRKITCNQPAEDGISCVLDENINWSAKDTRLAYMPFTRFFETAFEFIRAFAEAYTRYEAAQALECYRNPVFCGMMKKYD